MKADKACLKITLGNFWSKGQKGQIVKRPNSQKVKQPKGQIAKRPNSQKAKQPKGQKGQQKLIKTAQDCLSKYMNHNEQHLYKRPKGQKADKSYLRVA